MPEQVSVALTELAGEIREGLLALAVGTGLQVMAAIMEEDVTAACEPKGRHDPDRTATRHGHGAGSVSLGGRRVPVRRPRMRAVDGSGELAVPAYELFSDTEVLGRTALDRMLGGLSTRRSGVGLERMAIHLAVEVPVGRCPRDNRPAAVEPRPAPSPSPAGALPPGRASARHCPRLPTAAHRAHRPQRAASAHAGPSEPRGRHAAECDGIMTHRQLPSSRRTATAINDHLTLWAAAIEADATDYHLPANGPWTSVVQSARLFATWSRDEAVGRPAPALCRRCGLLLRAVHLDDPHQQLHPWCTPPGPAGLQPRVTDRSGETMSAPRDGVHDVRPRPRSPGCLPADVEALRTRVAILRATLGFPDDDLVDEDEAPADAGVQDWAEVEQVISGLRRRGASTAARRVAVQRLTRLGLSAREIGQRIGVTERSVVRYRATRTP